MSLSRCIPVAFSLFFVTSVQAERLSDFPSVFNEQAEQRPMSPYYLKDGQQLFVQTDLTLRSQPIARPDTVVGILKPSDVVRVLSTDIANGDYVRVQVVDSPSLSVSSEDDFFVAYKYLHLTPPHSLGEAALSSDYFIIQNVATEKLRLYKKSCEDGNCRHRMIMQAETVVGERGRSETQLGYYHLYRWRKFYEDIAGHYPAWYHPDYPMPPSADEGILAWDNDEYLPTANASWRGAFGWYTAIVVPNHGSQWTHGTYGWGANKNKMIEAVRGAFANMFSDPRSNGCTRVNNEVIAYLRQMASVGTPILKVYALEGYRDISRDSYSENPGQWDYILTKNGSRRNGQLSDRAQVIADGTPQDEWLEEGTFQVNQYPEAEVFLEGSQGAESSRNGNVYALDYADMTGVYLVDDGLLLGYQHPSQLKVGGHRHRLLPEFVTPTEVTDFEMPRCPTVRADSHLASRATHVYRRGRRTEYVHPRCHPFKPEIQ